MPLFPILAGFLFLGIAIATVVVVIVLLLGANKRSSGATLLRLFLCSLPMGACMLLISWFFGPVDYESPADLAGAYQAEFHELPPADVTNIEARQIVVGDSGAAWLRFRASSETIERLLLRFSESDKRTFMEAAGQAPAWWTPKADKVEFFFSADHWSKDWSRSTAYAAVDRTKGVMYFHHEASD